MATIPTVADNDLILTDWGNAVAAELNNNTVKKTGGTITGNVSVSGTLSAGGRITCGGDMVSLPPPSANAPPRHAATGSVPIRQSTGDTMSGILQPGQVASAATEGVSVRTDGPHQSSIAASRWRRPNSLPNLVLGRTGHQPQAPAASTSALNGRFGHRRSVRSRSPRPRRSPTTRHRTPGSSSRPGTSLTPPTSPDLGAKVYRGRWIADQGQGDEWVFLNSTDVEPVAPYAVAGERRRHRTRRRDHPPTTRPFGARPAAVRRPRPGLRPHRRLRGRLMATRLIGTDDADPRLPADVIAATQGTTAADLAPGNTLTEAKAYTDARIAATGGGTGGGVALAQPIVRADLNTLADAGLLVVGALYVVTDESPPHLSVATAASTYLTADTLRTYSPGVPPTLDQAVLFNAEGDQYQVSANGLNGSSFTMACFIYPEVDPRLPSSVPLDRPWVVTTGRHVGHRHRRRRPVGGRPG